MNLPIFAGLAAAGVVLLGFGGAASAACDPVGSTKFVCGTINSEDLIHIPGTPWIIASGLAEGDHPEGHMYLINARDHAMKVLFPSSAVTYRQDTKTYQDCPGAPDEKNFSAHGLNIRRDGKGDFTLYVVHHGGRESIEV